MDCRKGVNVLLENLGKTLELSSVQLDQNDQCLILFDDKIVLNLEFNEQESALYIYSYIALLPFISREFIFEMLLEANLFWKISQKATFAIDKMTKTIVLQQKFDLPFSDTSEFEDKLAIFVDTVELWMKKIDEICAEAETLMDTEENSENQKKKTYGSWKN